MLSGGSLRSTVRAEGRTPIKVLVIIPTLEVGGAETDLVRNLPWLDRARFEVVVWTFRAQGMLAPLLLARGIEIVGPTLTKTALPARLTSRQSELRSPDNRPYLRRVVRAARDATGLAYAAARFIRLRDFDVIHAILPNAYFVAVLANVLAGRRPLVMSRLSQNWYQQDHWLLGIVERYVLHRAADAAIGNSNAILQELRIEGFPDRKLSLVRNGIDAAAFDAEISDRRGARARLSISKDALVFSSVANLHVYKGHVDLIEALSHLRSRLPENWLLLAAGADVDGNLGRLRRLSDERGLARHVRFLGQRRDIAAILSAADIHVSASHCEGFPNNILEAMCAGLPVVATAVGGVPEQVLDGLTGLLVPPRSPVALAEALDALAHDPEGRTLLGRRGRQRVEREFPLERSVAAFEEAYEGLARLRVDRTVSQRSRSIGSRGGDFSRETAGPAARRWTAGLFGLR